jgi:hypothetical protein
MTSYSYCLSVFIKKSQVGSKGIKTSQGGGGWGRGRGECWYWSKSCTSDSLRRQTLVRQAPDLTLTPSHPPPAPPPKAAVYLGFVVFIVGWVFQTVQIGASLPYSPTYYYSKNKRAAGRAFFWIFNFFPWNPLTKGILDLGGATASSSSPGLRWSQRDSYCRCVMGFSAVCVEGRGAVGGRVHSHNLQIKHSHSVASHTRP